MENIIAIDFDGTIVEDGCFPEIGKMKPFAREAILAMKQYGYKLILFTCRNNHDPALEGRNVLSEAIQFLADNGIVFDAVNCNVPGLPIAPSPKPYFNLLIDDKAIGANIDWGVIGMALAEAEFKEQIIKGRPTGAPEQKQEVDLSLLRIACANYVEGNKEGDADLIFETAIEALYGDKVWETINRK